MFQQSRQSPARPMNVWCIDVHVTGRALYLTVRHVAFPGRCGSSSADVLYCFYSCLLTATASCLCSRQRYSVEFCDTLFRYVRVGTSTNLQPMLFASAVAGAFFSLFTHLHIFTGWALFCSLIVFRCSGIAC